MSTDVVSSERASTFSELAPNIARWLAYEQTVNERILDDRVFRSIDDGGNVAKRFRPETRAVWRQDMVLVPASTTRGYGFPRAALESTFGLGLPEGRAVQFVHPQSHGLYRERIDAHGVTSSELSVTPTASYRSLLAWRRPSAPALLKVSLDTMLGRTKRVLREVQIARGIVVSRVLETIPVAHREHLKFEWFSERAGMVDKRKGHGWLLRHVPPSLGAGADFVPAFSLISRRQRERPLLCELISQSGLVPEQFVIDRVLVPYVNVLAYLLLEQGIAFEGHTQNVLFELSGGRLTGKLALRDLSDSSINLALRIAKQKELPAFATGFLPEGSPFPGAVVASDHRTNARRGYSARAGDTVERYGLLGFVGSINTSMQRFFPGYRADHVATRYLELWQHACVGYLAVKPLFRKKPLGIAIEEAVAHFLDHVEWGRVSRSTRASLPASAEDLLVAGRAPRHAGRGYRRVESAWGELFVDGGHPAFFRPGF